MERGRTDIDAIVRSSTGAARIEWGKAADVGTAVHEAIEAELWGASPGDELMGAMIRVDPPFDLDVERALRAWRKWRDEDEWGASLQTVATEVAMVSEKLRIGGTVDWVAHDGASLVVADFKTSKSPRLSHIIQGTIYALMWEELYGQDVEEIAVIRIPKTGGPVEVIRAGGKTLESHKRAATALVKADHWGKAAKRMHRLA